jgi:hypothetical protein
MESEHLTNLKQHRSDADAWKRRGWHRVIDGRTALSLASIAGAALVLIGATQRRSDRRLGRRSGHSTWWLVSGVAVGCAAAGLGTRQWLRHRSGSELSSADVVTQQSVDSFPASDPPSSNATTATT